MFSWRRSSLIRRSHSPLTPARKSATAMVSRLRYTAGEQSGECFGRDCLTEIITLPFLTAMGLKERALFRGLHAFCNHPQPEAFAEIDDGTDDGSVLGT